MSSQLPPGEPQRFKGQLQRNDIDPKKCNYIFCQYVADRGGVKHRLRYVVALLFVPLHIHVFVFQNLPDINETVFSQTVCPQYGFLQ